MAPKVLIVDDEKSIRDLITTWLVPEGFECEAAQNGKEAIGAFLYSLYSTPFQLILLDVTMPDIDGLEVLDIIRKEESLRKVRDGEGIPIVMLTGLKKTCMEAWTRGCDDYILKPVKSSELIQKLKNKLR